MNTLAFDHYTRYKTAALFADSVRAGAEPLSILEIGANEQRHLEKFLPTDIVSVTDIHLPKHLLSDERFFIADATDLAGIADAAYDIVIALDVYEHIPSEKRKRFIFELSRVSKYGVFFSFPFCAAHVQDAEQRVNAYFKSLIGCDYPWLKEHIENGLPEKEQTEKFIKSAGCAYYAFEHGAIDIWERMTKAHFLACTSERMISYRSQIDAYYNKNIYLKDKSEKHYRVFYAIGKSAAAIEAARRVDTLLSEKNVSPDEKAFLNAQLDDLRSVHVSLRQAPLRNTPPVATQTCVVYLEKSHEGFTPDSMLTFPLSAGHRFSVSFLLEADTTAIRFDPLEGNFCVLRNLSLKTERGVLAYTANGVNAQGMIIFETLDPQIVAMIEGQRYVNISGEMIAVKPDGSEFLTDILRSSDALQTALDALQTALIKNILISNERDQYIQLYNAISHAKFWKMTKPLRLLVALAKKAVKKIPVLRLPYKALYYVKNAGVKQTLCATPAYLSRVFHGSPVSQRPIDAIDAIELVADEPKEAAVEQTTAQTIKFSIVLISREPQLRRPVESVLAQSYHNWELCLAIPDGDENLRLCCNEYARQDDRVRIQNFQDYEQITPEAWQNGSDYIVFAADDAELAHDALTDVFASITSVNPDVIYTDEVRTDADGNRTDARYKPDWSPDLLACQNYIGGLLVVKSAIVEKIGWIPDDPDGASAFDFILRVSEITNEIYHLPKILYTRQAKTGAAAWLEKSKRAGGHVVRYDKLRKRPLVSIIIPFKDGLQFNKRCVASILEKSTYINFEIILLNNRSEFSETTAWAEYIQKREPRVKVVTADFSFNWSRLNNYGLAHAHGEVLIFMNNDMEIRTPDWIERLSENALRDEIGVVGPLLLYEDETIQHAGVVVGMNGHADHIAKGGRPSEQSIFVSPLASRNVLAVTGACLAVSKRTIETIGTFDEEFIVCGSDVEFCLRAYEAGYHNLYNPNVIITHFESQTRNGDIPIIDFHKSFIAYAPYKENGDPYFNPGLNINSILPQATGEEISLAGSVVNYLRRKTNAKSAAARSNEDPGELSYAIPGVLPILPRPTSFFETETRLNLLIPTLYKPHIFGGVSSALLFFKTLSKLMNVKSRIIITDYPYNPENCFLPEGFLQIDAEANSDADNQILDITGIDRNSDTIPVGKRDIFIATIWWTAFNIKPIMNWQKKQYHAKELPLLYLIQDYETRFYPASASFLLADSTYNKDIPIAAVFNSKWLADFFKNAGYTFAHSFCFEPFLNPTLASFLRSKNYNAVRKKKIVLVYGRPSVIRNAYELAFGGLSKWCAMQADIDEWEIISLGEEISNIKLTDQKYAIPMGKVSLLEYAALLMEAYMGVSLMLSPHPSYPPLEMAAFGVKTISNAYENKDLSAFSENICSLNVCDADSIAQKLSELADAYTQTCRVSIDTPYVKGNDDLQNVCEAIHAMYKRAHE